MDAMRIEQDALEAGRVVIAGGKAGWTAPPEHRRCRHTKEAGERCENWTRVGETICHKHQRYAGTDALAPIKVPLLEDPTSILLTITQTVRALALGTMPQGNARAMLYGCNIAEQVLRGQFERAKWLAQQRKEAARAAASQPVREERADPGAAASMALVAGSETGAPEAIVAGTDVSGSGSELHEPEEAAWVPEPEVETPLRGLRPRFPDVKRDWDKALARAEAEMTRNLHPAEGESSGEWLARLDKPIVPAHARAAEGVRVEQAEWSGEEDVTAFQGVPNFMTNGWNERQIAEWYYANAGSTGPEARKEAERVAGLIVQGVARKRAMDAEGVEMVAGGGPGAKAPCFQEPDSTA